MKSGQTFIEKVKSQKVLLIMSVPFMIHLVIFAYIPMWGILLAFQNFKPALGFFEQTWVGFRHFERLFTGGDLPIILRNTLAMSSLQLIFGTFFAIFFAIMIHETRNGPFKKMVQTTSYLPHFVSWVVTANIVLQALSTDGGLVNDLLVKLGIIDQPILFMGEPKFFWWIITWSSVWKGMGWGAIVYIAAMTSISPELYEAASIDGASRMQKIIHITLPGVKPTFMILLILNIGMLLSAGYEQQYLFSNPLVKEVSENFGLYTFRWGIQLGKYSYSTAAGFFNSIVNITLLLSANFISRKLDQETLF